MNGSAVSITRCVIDAPPAVFADPDALPPGGAALLATAEFFLTPAWWHSMLEAGLPDGAEPRFLLFARGGRPAALLAMQLRAGGRVLESLTNPYTCLYRPLLAPGLDEAALRGIGGAFARYCRAWPSVRLEALAEDTPGLEALLSGARAAGLAVARFDHFGDWHEPVAGLSWEDYFQGRPGELRETLRRKLRRADRDDQVSHEVFTAPEHIEAGIATYEDVYARSWKPLEPYPRFNAALMRHAAAIGALRLGVLRARGRAVAVQLWVVMNGRAAVLKLAHDEAYKTLSPGTVLTALMIRGLLDGEHVDELDFGRGDDAYKRLWTTARRQRIGVLLINPWRPSGAALLARQWLGGLRRRLVGPSV
jgi:hypothetical protein